VVAVAIALVCLAATGCGRFGFDASEIAGDGASADATLDTPDAALGAFGPPTKISVSSGSLEDDPTLTADLLELVFESDRAGGAGSSDLWLTRRSSVGAAWATPIPIVELNTNASEEHPGLSSDGLTLWFASDRPGGLGSFDIYVSTRADRASGTPWSAPVLASNLNDAANNESPQVTDSGLVMVLASGPNGNEDLFVSTRASTLASWPMPSAITELNQASSSETAPALSPDLRTIYFTSNRDGIAAGLYTATRETTADPFGTPLPITELDADGEQTDPWLSPDQRTIVYVSAQDGTRDLFEASR
jgi:Tol biopolymer transport system component